MTDDLTITMGQIAITGWTDIRVTRGIERLPSDFSIGMTELYNGELAALGIAPGSACSVELGEDLVITGYIDHFIPSFGPSDHSIRLTGRSKCADLVDCAAEWPGGQISNSNVLGIAQRLASVYGPVVNGKPEGIQVTSSVASNKLPILPQLNIMLGESAFEIIDRVARGSAVLAYDLPDGGLYLSQTSNHAAASGFTEGVNVQNAYIDYSANLRYSEYRAYIQSTQTYLDAGEAGNKLGVVTDPNCLRHRRMVIISEGGGLGNDIAIQRAHWEAARRAGRSMVVRLVTDSWRDESGALWEPNTLVPVSLPRLNLDHAELLITEVTFLRANGRGTTAELTLMPPSAFVPQPINLTPLFGDVAQVHQ
jgi:prophage tail gpP-like protein